MMTWSHNIPSLAAYEDCRSILSYERSFYRPMSGA
jgi:hypothetical protein